LGNWVLALVQKMLKKNLIFFFPVSLSLKTQPISGFLAVFISRTTYGTD